MTTADVSQSSAVCLLRVAHPRENLPAGRQRTLIAFVPSHRELIMAKRASNDLRYTCSGNVTCTG
jgi:hypothetical protein